MAISRVFSLFTVAMLIVSAIAQSPSTAPSPSRIPNMPALSPSSKSPTPSPLASPTPAPAKSATPPPPPSSSPSPPSPPPSAASPSPSVALPPSGGVASAPAHNGAVFNRAGLAAVAVGFFTVALVA